MISLHSLPLVLPLVLCVKPALRPRAKKCLLSPNLPLPLIKNVTFPRLHQSQKSTIQLWLKPFLTFSARFNAIFRISSSSSKDRRRSIFKKTDPWSCSTHFLVLSGNQINKEDKTVMPRESREYFFPPKKKSFVFCSFVTRNHQFLSPLCTCSWLLLFIKQGRGGYNWAPGYNYTNGYTHGYKWALPSNCTFSHHYHTVNISIKNENFLKFWS